MTEEILSRPEISMAPTEKYNRFHTVMVSLTKINLYCWRWKDRNEF